MASKSDSVVMSFVGTAKEFKVWLKWNSRFPHVNTKNKSYREQPNKLIKSS